MPQTGLGLNLGGGGQSVTFDPPSGFGWDYESDFGPIIRRGRKYYNSFDTSDYANPEGVTTYLAPDGSSSNDGLSAENPKDSIHDCLDIADCSKIICAPGYYNRTTFFASQSGISLPRDCAIVCEGGRAEFAMADSSYTWSKTAGRTNVYQANINRPYLVTDRTNLDADNMPIPLTRVADLATCDSTPGSWYWDETPDLLYVHTFDAREPAASSSDICAMRSGLYSFRFSGNHNLYLENIDIYGGENGSLLYDTTDGTSADIITENCKLGYSEGNGMSLFDVRLAYSKNCISRYNNLDGFSLNSDQTAGGKWLLQDCVASLNGTAENLGEEGDQFDNNCNGFTGHDGTSMAVLNGNATECDGPQYAFVDANTEALLLGCHAGESLATNQDSTSDSGFVSQGGPEAWLENCSSGDSYYARVVQTATMTDLGGFIDGSQEGDFGTVS